MTVTERKKLVKQKNLCPNCLRAGHKADCPSLRTCQKCPEKHNTLLHVDPSTTPSSAQAVVPTIPTSSSLHCGPSGKQKTLAIFATLVVNVRDVHGVLQPCRVFVDSGSDSHFVPEDLLTRLGLHKKKVHAPTNVLGNAPGPTAKGQVSLTLESKSQKYSHKIEALVLQKFAGLIPSSNFKSNWPHIRRLKLSDPNFNRAQYCDILFNGKEAFHILLPQKVEDLDNAQAPVAWLTKFGWMVCGQTAPNRPTRPQNPVSVHHASTSELHDELNSSLTRFWHQEEPAPLNRDMSANDMACEDHYASTHTQNPDGTYTVRLPFKPGSTPLGKSRGSALRRFHTVENRFARDPALKAEYVGSMKQYLDLGYAEPIPPADLHKPCTSVYYMPHHVVAKPDNPTTPYRVVYDASAKTSTGVSLNDTLFTGPKLQVDLYPLLIRFMSHKIVMSADIWKFYPQTSVHKEDRDFLRFLWRQEPHLPVEDFRMTRVNFGVSAAPYLAIRSLHRLTERTQTEYPLASQVIREDFLVDNLLSGAPDLRSALDLQTDLLKVMDIGGLKLTKWTSNSRELINAVAPELRGPSTSLSIDEGEFLKTIGILWNPDRDIFSIKISVPDPPIVTTKRSVLSTIARTFDPLGWLSPVTIRPKILIQQLWTANLGWDEPLPLTLHQQWRKYCEELPLLQTFSLPRWAFAPLTPESSNYTHQLHGFSDGSDLAHAACVYVRTEDSTGGVSVRLLTAKTKVNPITKQTTPRSELCGAVLLTNLITNVISWSKVNFSSVHCWTDSSVVLGRISPDKKLPIFELNRIRKILDALPPHHWNHVRGDQNPADAPSRGISAHELLTHPLWLNGPSWLLDPIPDNQPVTASVATTVPTPMSDLIHNCSSYGRMRFRMGYVLRFVHNCRAKKNMRRTGRLTVDELDLALQALLKVVQSECFAEAIDRCNKGLPIRSVMKHLHPFLDKGGILRVGGRLTRASIPYAHKHPAILPRHHHFSKELARSFHLQHLHAGPTLLLSILREQFWIISGPKVVKSVVRGCVTCHRHTAKTSNQLMGQLPISRITPAPPFSQSGVDYAGPFHLALRTGRKPPIVKAYVVVFICMVTKAMHLELASDLSTPSFIGALIRLISRRGLPADIYTDEGTNFVGAKAEVEELHTLLTSAEHQDAQLDFLTPNAIRFHTNPPGSPHHGGLWEAAVKSMKHHVRRIMGSRHMTVEEFTTLLCQVEAILNSRPLTPLTDDSSDLGALTPGHFLIGRPLVALPYPDLSHISIGRLDRWQAVQSINQHIWKAWNREYLSHLQTRLKWCSPLPNLEPGTMVLILDDQSLGPQKWKLGRIVETFPGPDGNTRVCDVRTNITPKRPQGTILRRPVVKLSPLPI